VKIMSKLYIPVLLHVGEDGKITPKQIKAGYGGEWIRVDKITESRRRANFRVGGVGIRYTCIVSLEGISKSIYLFDEDGKWFVESENN
jgi:hypothetical protein